MVDLGEPWISPVRLASRLITADQEGGEERSRKHAGCPEQTGEPIVEVAEDFVERSFQRTGGRNSEHDGKDRQLKLEVRVNSAPSCYVRPQSRDGDRRERVRSERRDQADGEKDATYDLERAQGQPSRTAGVFNPEPPHAARCGATSNNQP